MANPKKPSGSRVQASKCPPKGPEVLDHIPKPKVPDALSIADALLAELETSTRSSAKTALAPAKDQTRRLHDPTLPQAAFPDSTLPEYRPNAASLNLEEGEGHSTSAAASSLDELSFGDDFKELVAEIGDMAERGDIKSVDFDPEDTLRAGEIEERATAEWAILKDSFDEMAERGILKDAVKVLEAFAVMGPPNEFGVRVVQMKYNGRFNYIDNDYRLLAPSRTNDWLEEADEFKVIDGILPMRPGIPVALTSKGGKSQFFTRDGEFFPASNKRIKMYYEGPKVPEEVEESSDEEIWEPIHLEENFETELQSLIYYETFSNKLALLSQRYSDDPLAGDAYYNLGKQIHSYRFESHEKDWRGVLSKIKGAVDASPLSNGHKTHLYIELLSTAVHQGMDAEGRSSLFDISELGDSPWIEYGLFEGGAIVSFNDSSMVLYTLVDPSGKLLYPKDKAFDKMDPFNNQVALVRRDGRYNFIRRDTGRLVSEEKWFASAYETRQGVTRVEIEGGRWNYMGGDGRWISKVDFEDARDFDEKGLAWVMLEGEEVMINTKGEVEADVSVESMKFVERYKEVRSQHLPKELVVQKMTDFLQEEQAKRKRDVGDDVHELFQACMADRPQNSMELIKVFGLMRMVISRMPTSQDASVVMGDLLGVVSNSRLETILQHRIKKFLLSDLSGRSISPSDLTPLPVTVYSLFQGVLEAHPEEEAEMLRVLEKTERLVGKYPHFARDRFYEIYPDIKGFVSGSELPTAMKLELYRVLLGISGKSDFYLQRGKKALSIESHRAVSPEAQDVIDDLSEARKRAMEGHRKLLFRRKFEEACELAMKGEARDATEIMDRITVEYPECAVENLKLGLAFFEGNAWGAAVPYLEKALATDPANVLAHRAMAIMLWSWVKSGMEGPSPDKSGLRELALDAKGHFEQVPVDISDKRGMELRRENLKFIQSRRRKIALLVAAGLFLAGGGGAWLAHSYLGKQESEAPMGVTVEPTRIPPGDADPQNADSGVKKKPSDQTGEIDGFNEAIDRRLKEQLRRLNAKGLRQKSNK